MMLKLMLILSLSRTRVDGMLQVGWKYEHRSVLHSHDHLVGIQFTARQVIESLGTERPVSYRRVWELLRQYRLAAAQA